MKHIHQFIWWRVQRGIWTYQKGRAFVYALHKAEQARRRKNHLNPVVKVRLTEAICKQYEGD